MSQCSAAQIAPRMREAAPDLLEALKEITRHSENVNTAFYGKGTQKAMRAAMEGQREILIAARAAIAKATGK